MTDRLEQFEKINSSCPLFRTDRLEHDKSKLERSVTTGGLRQDVKVDPNGPLGLAA